MTESPIINETTPLFNVDASSLPLSTTYEPSQSTTFIMEEREESEQNIMFKPGHNAGFKQLMAEHELHPNLPQDQIGDAEEVYSGVETLPSEYVVPVKTLGLWPLTVLVFYSVSGGPFGVENAVRYGGAYFSLLGFLILPFVWSIPEALITAELGSAFPEASGSVAWVEEAFGPKWGLLGGYLAWISGATDNAIYPALFLGYLISSLHNGLNASDKADDGANLEGEDWGIWRFVFLSVSSILLAYMNFRGLEIVGKMAIIIALVSMSPFVLMCIIGAGKVQTSRWFQRPTTQTGQLWNVDWRPFLNNLFWNLNSFDSGGNFAGEAIDSHTTYPRAMFLSVILVIGCYVCPLLVALGATESLQDEWREGHLGVIASDIAGGWLGAWTVVAAAISNLALFQAEMSADAYQLLGMAERGLIPAIFGIRSSHGTPTYGIILGTMVIVALSTTHFDALVEMLNFSYCLNLLMEYAAFVKLRISRPEVHRPYRVPLNTFGCALLVTPPIIFVFVIIYLSTIMTLIVCGGMILFGFIVYEFQIRMKDRKLCEYNQADQATVQRQGCYNGLSSIDTPQPAECADVIS